MMQNRECGECNVCCFEAAINEGTFVKPAEQRCMYLKEGSKGCLIFGTSKRPHMCKQYECAWKKGVGDLNDRPDISGVMISMNKLGIDMWIFVLDLKPLAHLMEGKNIVIDAISKYDMAVMLSDFEKRGFGDYVLIKEKLMGCTENVRGEFVSDYAKGIKMYKLKE